MNSLKQQLKDYFFSIYPNTITNRDMEDLSRERGYNCETGRKRAEELVCDGVLKSWVEKTIKQDGKTTETVYYRANLPIILSKIAPQCPLSDLNQEKASSVVPQLFPVRKEPITSQPNFYEYD
jgi:hypothetical protein